MSEKTSLTGFIAISSLYLKITSPTDTLVNDEEIDLFIGSVDQSNLVSIIGRDKPTDKLPGKAA